MSLTAAHDLLDRLMSTGNTVKVEAPDTLLVGGPLTDELRAAIRQHKPMILAILAESRRTRAFPCSCCGRFYFREPSVTCHWCRAGTPEKPADAREATRYTPPTINRPCPSCGGGLQPNDPDGAECWSCKRLGVNGGGR